MKRWLKQLKRHYQSEPAFTANERKLRKANEPAGAAAMLLLPVEKVDQGLAAESRS